MRLTQRAAAGARRARTLVQHPRLPRRVPGKPAAGEPSVRAAPRAFSNLRSPGPPPSVLPGQAVKKRIRGPSLSGFPGKRERTWSRRPGAARGWEDAVLGPPAVGPAPRGLAGRVSPFRSGPPTTPSDPPQPRTHPAGAAAASADAVPPGASAWGRRTTFPTRLRGRGASVGVRRRSPCGRMGWLREGSFASLRLRPLDGLRGHLTPKRALVKASRGLTRENSAVAKPHFPPIT